MPHYGRIAAVLTCAMTPSVALALNNKAGDCYGLRTEHDKLAGDLY